MLRMTKGYFVPNKCYGLLCCFATLAILQTFGIRNFHHVCTGPKVKISFVQARLDFGPFDPGIIIFYHKHEQI